MSVQMKDTPADRLAVSANAKKVMLERFNARPAANDPAVIERQAAQKAISDARQARLMERKALQEAELTRQAAEQAALVLKRQAEALEQAEQQARKLQEIAIAERDYKAKALALAAEQKAARDAKYAKRKAR